MQHFQFILIIIGLFAIVGVLIHGYAVSRKEKTSAMQELSNADDLASDQSAHDDQDGILGDVRILRNANEEDDKNFDISLSLDEDTVEDINFNFSSQELEPDKIADSFVMDKDEPIEEEFNEFANNGDDKYHSEVDAHQQPAAAEVQDHFIFNVAAKEGQVVRGHELLQFFLTAGFRFGEMSIFHRHLHSDGTGPVLFSIANMLAPGTFDPENMEQFSSQGVSFFLTAPNHDIDIKKSFDMMLVAVEQMAEEFDCVVLNANREPLTEQQFRDYHERLLRYI